MYPLYLRLGFQPAVIAIDWKCMYKSIIPALPFYCNTYCFQYEEKILLQLLNKWKRLTKGASKRVTDEKIGRHFLNVIWFDSICMTRL